MSIEQEKMIVESLSSIYPMQKFEEDAIETVLDALPRWIPVTERLPKTQKWRTTFLVTTNTGFTTSMEWENAMVRGKEVSRWIWKDRLSPWGVLAWMPLPEPYKGVTE